MEEIQFYRLGHGRCQQERGRNWSGGGRIDFGSRRGKELWASRGGKGGIDLKKSPKWAQKMELFWGQENFAHFTVILILQSRGEGTNKSLAGMGTRTLAVRKGVTCAHVLYSIF